MVNKETLRRWRGEGILPPSIIVNPKWRCPVCGAPPTLLVFLSDKTPEAIGCNICSLPFSLSQHPSRHQDVKDPLPAVSDEWISVWRLGFKDRGFAKSARLISITPFALMFRSFTSPKDALEFFEGKKKEVSV